ncbi:hypothetical protein MPTK2_4g02520 [Marchantia polymorpha subsp. ruderalis]
MDGDYLSLSANPSRRQLPAEHRHRHRWSTTESSMGISTFPCKFSHNTRIDRIALPLSIYSFRMIVYVADPNL